MNDQINIRPYIMDDYPRIREILEQGELYYEEFDSSERIGEKIARDPNSVFVATDSGQVVGTTSIMEDGRMAFIFRLAVAPSHRERGIGASLMQRAEEELTNRGCSEWHILVNINFPKMIDHFKRRGYQEGSAYRWMVKEPTLPPNSRR